VVADARGADEAQLDSVLLAMVLAEYE